MDQAGENEEAIRQGEIQIFIESRLSEGAVMRYPYAYHIETKVGEHHCEYCDGETEVALLIEEEAPFPSGRFT